jgi:threonine synthase
MPRRQDATSAVSAGRFSVACSDCGQRGEGASFRQCRDCRGGTAISYASMRPIALTGHARMWDFAGRLPVGDAANIVSLGEGGTPLLGSSADRNAALYFKNEGQNPTGSQKDRAMSVAVSVAKERRVSQIVVASTGSVGVSCAAYSAHAGIRCLIMVPAGTPVERLQPMMALGARVVEIDGTFEQIEAILASLDSRRWYQASTIMGMNCFQGEGPKTIAYEIAGQLGRVPDWVVVPIGGGGTLHGIWRGFVELVDLGSTAHVPRMVGVQARALNLLERLDLSRVPTADEVHAKAPDERTESVCRNLRHAVPPDWRGAVRAVRESGGLFCSVTDEQALDWQLRLGREEGIFCEPSSAVVGQAVADLRSRGIIEREQSVVAVITGSGFREVGILGAMNPRRCTATVGEAELERLLRAVQ